MTSEEVISPMAPCKGPFGRTCWSTSIEAVVRRILRGAAQEESCHGLTACNFTGVVGWRRTCCPALSSKTHIKTQGHQLYKRPWYRAVVGFTLNFALGWGQESTSPSVSQNALRSYGFWFWNTAPAGICSIWCACWA